MQTDVMIGDDALLRPRILISYGHLDQALLELSQIVEQSPSWAEAWAMVAQALSLRCDFSEALVAADKALSYEPANLFAQKLRTGLLLQLGRNHDALLAAQRLIAIHPEGSEAYAFLAFAHAFCGNEPDALDAARRSKKLEPHRGVGHQALCVVHLTFRRWSKAERHANATLAIEGPKASVYHDLGVACWEQGKYGDARKAFKEAAKLDPRFTGADRRYERRSGFRMPALPAVLALIAGIALVPLVHAPIAFVTVAIVGVIALVLAGKGAGMSWHEGLPAALAVVLLFDLAAFVHSTGVVS